MKRIFTILLALIPVLLSAQDFWSVVITDRNKSHFKDKNLFQDTVLLVSGSVSDISCPWHELYAYDLSGKRLWKVEGRHDRICVDSEFIYTVGYQDGGEIASAARVYLSKYDRDGNTIFSKEYPDEIEELPFIFEPNNLIVTSGGHLLASSSKSIIISDVEGSFLKEYAIGVSDKIRSVKELNANEYLLHDDHNIYKMDPEFTLLNSYNFTEDIKKLHVHEGAVYLLFDKRLVRLNADLEISDTIYISNHQIDGFEMSTNSLWVHVNGGSEMLLVTIQDDATLKTATFPILVSNVQFVAAGGRFTFFGDSYSDQIAIYQFKDEQSVSEIPALSDVEIVDFNIYNIELVWSTFLEDFVSAYWFDSEVAIKNSGKDTLRSFAVYSLLSGGMFCNGNYIYGGFDGLNLLPGEQQTFRLSRAAQGGLTKGICMEVLAPNKSLEVSTDNNHLCKIFDIETSLHGENATSFKAFPNPVTDFLTVESTHADIEKIEVINVHGVAVINQSGIGKNNTIDMSMLGMGLYFVKIHAGGSVSSRTIMKK